MQLFVYDLVNQGKRLILGCKMSRSSRGKAKDATAQIEAANQASNKDFISKYMKPGYVH